MEGQPVGLGIHVQAHQPMSIIKRRKEKRPKAIWTQVRRAKPVPSALKCERVKKPRKRVVGLSAERRRQIEAYAVARVKYLRDNSICLARWPSAGSEGRYFICAEKAKQVHHKAGRRGPALLDETKWMAVCSACHRRIHAEPNLAANMGSIEPSGWRGGA